MKRRIWLVLLFFIGVSLVKGWALSCIPDGDVAPLGSRDGRVNIGDALVTLRFALGLETPSQEDLCHADVAPLGADGMPNPDGRITIGDALVILRKALQLVNWNAATVEDLKKALIDFLEGPSEGNYTQLLEMLNAAPNTSEARILKGAGMLFTVYNDHRDFFNQVLKIDLNSLNASSANILYNLLTAPDYAGGILTVMDDVISRLDQAEAEFSQVLAASGTRAAGNLASLTFPDGTTVYFDELDVKIMRFLAEFLKAICLYVESLDIGANNWLVNGTDIRDLLLAANGTLNGTFLNGTSNETLRMFLMNNSRLLTYRDSSKLEEFKQAFSQARQTFEEIVNEFATLSEEALKARQNHAFNLDDTASVAIAQAVERIFSSLETTFNDPSAELVWPVTANETIHYVDGGDGYYYPEKKFDIYLEYATPSGNATLYDLLNGGVSPRDIFLGKFFLDYSNQTRMELFRSGVEMIEWDKPIPTFFVPEANITIDENASDWSSVPVFYSDQEVTVKIARNAGGDFYVYVSIPRLATENGSFWVNFMSHSTAGFYEIDLGCDNYYGLSCSGYMGDWNWNSVNSFAVIGNYEFEIVYSGAYNYLVRSDAKNSFYLNINTTQTSSFVHQFFKLLP